MQTKFPEGFLWGTATSAHQVEGNNVYNDSWVMEHVPGTIYAEPSGDACDHYHRYPQDIKLLADLGFNSYRFSLEWSRIEPEEGRFSLAALEHYRRMLAACHEHGMTPMVTFHHFTSPRWLMAAGGWEGEQTPGKFARFCERTTQHLGDLIGVACTINEPNIGPAFSNMLPDMVLLKGLPMWSDCSAALGTTPEKFAPFALTTSQRSVDTKISAHHQAKEAIKSGPGDFPLGITLSLQDIQAVEGGEVQAERVLREVNTVFLEAVRGDDFVGVQTYYRVLFGPDGLIPPDEGADLVHMGNEFRPEALEATIRQAIAVAGIPVIVTESGVATTDDSKRINFVQSALKGVANCLNDGLDVRGYYYWSALDNFEWNWGYEPTFGLIAVDRTTQKRTVKPSAKWLGGVARKNEI